MHPEEVDAERRRARLAAAHYLEKMRRRAARRRGAAAPPAWAGMPLALVRYCVIDLETTGRRPADDEVVEVGAVRVAGGELGAELATLVDPMRAIDPSARAVHGISDAEVAGAPPLAAVLPHLLALAADSVLVFHNAGFDLGFLQRALVETGREPWRAPVVDTLAVARALLGGPCSLGRVGQRLGIDAPHLHRALPDARLTAMVLVEFLAALEDAGATMLGEVPGVRARAPRPRRRGSSPGDPVRARFERACAAREALEVAIQLGAGLAPLELRVRPERLVGRACLAEDLDRDCPIVLDLGRVLAAR
jgi:DNA polymerase III epsilon subunit family exonuclease